MRALTPAAIDPVSPGPDGNGGGWLSPAVLAHTVPFVSWIALHPLLNLVAPQSAWPYALQTVVGGALLVAFRPWRFYPRPRLRHIPMALLAGVLVLAAWVVPFLGAGDGMPWFQELYLRFGVLPLGRLPRVPEHSRYAPEACGWLLTLTRLAGSAFVIAVAEEFFWRGFLYRRLLQRDFLGLPLQHFDREAFWLCALLFGLEHREVVAGVAAGVVYAAVMMRTRDIWAAIVAHVCTNLLLGLHVITARAYGFW